MHKLVYLYTEAIANTLNSESKLILAPAELDQDTFNESLALVQNFRERILKVDPVIFDMSNNDFSESYMIYVNSFSGSLE